MAEPDDPPFKKNRQPGLNIQGKWWPADNDPPRMNEHSRAMLARQAN
jgi:hypothetical protein